MSNFRFASLRQIKLWSLWMLSVMAVLTAGCSLNTSETPETVISGAPIVRIASPQPNATYLASVSVNIQVVVTNAGEDIAHVEIKVDDQIISDIANPNSSDLPSFTINESWTAVGVGAHTLLVTAYRADGTASDPATVTFTIIERGSTETVAPTQSQPTVQPTSATEDEGGETPSDEAPTDDASPQLPDDPTNEPEEAPVSDNTPSVATARFTMGVNVRSGPGTNYAPPIGSFAAGDTAEITGVNPAGTWYEVRYYNTEAWVAAQYVEVLGDASGIPVDQGPPPPANTPIPTTAPIIPALPATAAPTSNVDLVVGLIRLNPNPAVCNQTAELNIDIANLGSGNYAGGGEIRIVDTHIASGATSAQTVGSIPALNAGQTSAVGGIFLTVSTHFNEGHRITVTVDPNNTVPESNDGNNSNSIEYTLAQGSC